MGKETTNHPPKKRKRGQGEGSIFFIEEKKLWCAKITVGKDENGRQKRKAFYGKTRKEVQEKLTAAVNDVNNDTYIEPSRMTVGEWLDIWLKDYKKKSVKPTTYTVCHRYCKNYIKPAIGHCLLKDLRNMHIQRIVNDMIDKELSPETIGLVHTVISGALKQAVKNDLVKKNAAADVLLPKPRKYTRRVLTVEEQRRLVETAKTQRHGEFVILALATGLRCGELLALTWDDVDFEKSELHVNKTTYTAKDPDICDAKWEVRVGSPKTETSDRVVPLLPGVLEMLGSMKDAQEMLKRSETAWRGFGFLNEDNLVFCNSKGTLVRPDNMRSYFKAILLKAGINSEGMGIHSLRHTFATRGLENGIDMKIMQELLGHASIKMTADIYTHVLPDTKKDSIQKLEGTINL